MISEDELFAATVAIEKIADERGLYLPAEDLAKAALNAAYKIREDK